MVTIKDIAERAGVSRATVTFVLNRRPVGLKIRDETRDRVLKVATELGYMPNSSARAMRNGRSGCIALLLSSEPWKTYFPLSLLEGIQLGLDEHDLHLVVASLSDAKLTQEHVLPKMLREWMADGLLIDYNSGIPPEAIEVIDKNKIPAIWINVKRSHDCVRPADSDVGYAATQHLLGLGHRCIAYIDYSFGAQTDPAMIHYSTLDRFEGYSKAMTEAGRQVRRIPGIFAPDDRLTFSRSWLADDNRPTAVVTYGPQEAYPILYAATALCGLRVPDDLSVISFFDTAANAIGIDITGYELPERDLGQLAVSELMQKIEYPVALRPARQLELTFHAGQTTAPPP